MKRTQAEALLKTDFRTLSYEEFLKYRVKIVDALRESEAEYGYEQAVADGYYVFVGDAGAVGFSPKNIWLTHELSQRLNELSVIYEKILCASSYERCVRLYNNLMKRSA